MNCWRKAKDAVFSTLSGGRILWFLLQRLPIFLAGVFDNLHVQHARDLVRQTDIASDNRFPEGFRMRPQVPVVVLVFLLCSVSVRAVLGSREKGLDDAFMLVCGQKGFCILLFLVPLGVGMRLVEAVEVLLHIIQLLEKLDVRALFHVRVNRGGRVLVANSPGNVHIPLAEVLIAGGVADDVNLVEVGGNHVEAVGGVDGFEEFLVDVVGSSEAEAAEADAGGSDDFEPFVSFDVAFKDFGHEDVVSVVLLHAWEGSKE